MDKHNEGPAVILSQKTVIRTKAYEASIVFYTELLNLQIVEAYDDGNGSQGSIFRFGEEGSNALIEISEIKESHSYYQEAFSESASSNKFSIQLRTDNVSYWAERLQDKWEATGPILRPWGSQYLYLRDPDGMQIIIYQEAK